MDPTEHSHIPYVVILVKALEDWKAEASLPVSTSTRRQLNINSTVDCPHKHTLRSKNSRSLSSP